MTRYGTARSPQPTRAHTCPKRRQLEKGYANPTSQDDCPACAVDRAEGWAQLLDSVRREVFVNLGTLPSNTCEPAAPEPGQVHRHGTHRE